MTQDQDWARATTRRVAAEIRARRGKRSIQWLSDRTAACGHRVTRSRIVDLEGGTRGGVLGVAELLVIAAGLGVPPALLLYPVHAGDQVAPLPGLITDPWAAYQALTGEHVLVPGDPLPGGAELAGPNIAVQRTDPAVAAYLRHRDASAEYRRHRDAAAEPRADQASLAAAEASSAAAQAWLRRLAGIRRDMTASGWALPPLDIDEMLALEKMGASVPSATETL